MFSLLEKADPCIQLTECPLSDMGFAFSEAKPNQLNKTYAAQRGSQKGLGICVISQKYGGPVIKSLEDTWFSPLPAVLKAKICPSFIIQ